MGNYAKYWYLNYTVKEAIKFSPELKKELEDFGFVQYYEFSRSHHSHADEYELVYDIHEIDGEEYFYMIYAEHEQINWKNRFEDLCKKHNITIQKWMEG